MPTAVELQAQVGVLAVVVKDANCQPICVPCPPEGGSGEGSGGEPPGVTIPCCANPIPARLFATIIGTGIDGWDGLSIPLDYTNVGGAFPHHWVGVNTGDPCGTGTGGPPYQIQLDLRLRVDLPGGVGQPCRWDLTITDLTSGAEWCRPTGGPGLDNGNTCDPLTIDFEVPYQITDTGIGLTCVSCFGDTARNCFVSVTE